MEKLTSSYKSDLKRIRKEFIGLFRTPYKRWEYNSTLILTRNPNYIYNPLIINGLDWFFNPVFAPHRCIGHIGTN